MNAHSDVATIVAAAKSAELVALEAQFEETQASLRVVHRNLDTEREAANGAISSPFKVKNQTTMAAAAAKVATLTATAGALEKTSAELHRKIQEVRPASAVAVASALSPLRRQAANDIALAVRTLYSAIGRFNATSLALEKSGTSALVVPETFQILDHFVEKSAVG